MRATIILLGAGLALTSCAIGRTDPDAHPNAGSPYGRIIELLVTVAPERRARVAGELLWIEDDALVVRAQDAVLRVPLQRIVPRVGDGRASGMRSDPARELVGSARYPSPPDADQVRALLDALGLDEVRTLGSDGEADEADQALEPDASRGGVGPVRSGGLDAFLADARAAAARFERLEVAIAEGYRRLGPSFPGMGEHWVHPGRIVEGRIDPLRPAVVCYVRIDGEARLTSMAFTLPLDPDDDPPEQPFGRAAWHDHANTVDEESLLLAHPGSHGTADGPRLAMVHVWVWPDNPDGVLAQNNWRLPFAVAGLPFTGVEPSVDAARGLSLATADAGYYDDLFRAAADLSPEERAALRSLLAEHREMAAAWVEQRRLDGDLDAAGLADAAEVWSSLWDRIEKEVGPRTWRSLAVLR